jgi:hypothetical protein
MISILRLKGDFILQEQLPHNCPRCSCKEYYKQSDFRQATGLTIVGIASAITCVLFAMGYDWWTVWSPMFVVLVIDRLLNWSSPVAAICYDCGLIFRKVSVHELEKISGFDLDIYDRYQYPKRVEVTQSL